MAVLLNKIQSNFNNASKTYDGAAIIQRQAANFLVNKLLEIKEFKPKTILDLGTGTGYIPHLLMPIYPESSYTLNDIASEMIEVCKIKFSTHLNINYIHNDMRRLEVGMYDFIISNFALQWIEDIWSTLEFFYSKSSEVLAFSTLLKGTFQEWEIVLNGQQNIKLHNYPSAEELINFCKKIKNQHIFNYWVIDLPLFFENSLMFMRYLKSLGACATNNQVQLGKLRDIISQKKETLTVTYKVFFGIFKKGNT